MTVQYLLKYGRSLECWLAEHPEIFHPRDQYLLNSLWKALFLHAQSFRFIYRPVCLSHGPLRACWPSAVLFILIGLNKSSINTDRWRNSRGNCAFTGCCDAYSNEFKSIYTGPSFACVPLDCRQSQLSLPARFLHHLRPALPAIARVVCTGKTSFFFQRCTV